MTNTLMIEAEGLTKSYAWIGHERLTASGTSLAAFGSILGVLGPNGAGKTTVVANPPPRSPALMPAGPPSPDSTCAPRRRPCVATSAWRPRTPPSTNCSPGAARTW